MELIYITAAKYVSGYILELTFNTGEVKLFDFTQLYDKGICTKLQDIEYFKKKGYNEFDAQRKTMEYLSDAYGFLFREVK